jgi:hypothetical protein
VGVRRRLAHLAPDVLHLLHEALVLRVQVLLLLLVGVQDLYDCHSRACLLAQAVLAQALLAQDLLQLDRVLQQLWLQSQLVALLLRMPTLPARGPRAGGRRSGRRVVRGQRSATAPRWQRGRPAGGAGAAGQSSCRASAWQCCCSWRPYWWRQLLQ